MSLRGMLDKAKSWLSGPTTPEPLHHDAVRHTRFDAALYNELLNEAPALRSMVTDLNKQYDYTEDLVQDCLMQFFQAAPVVREASEMDTGRLVNRSVAVDLAKAPETAMTRTYTQHDKYGATMATIGVTSKVREYLQEHKDVQDKAEQAQQAEQQAQQEQQNLQDAADQAQAAADGLDAAMGGYEGEGPLTEAQAAAQAQAAQCQGDLTAALDALEQAQAAAESCRQEALTEAERARAALRKPIEQAVAKAGDHLAKEAELFAGWGVEPGEVEQMDFKTRASLAQRLRGQDLSQFIKELGRWRAMQKAQFARRVTAARDEVYDVELTGNLPDVLPSEFAHLGTDVGRLDFLVRMGEHQLVGKKYRGTEKIGQGAIICLIDTSSSMKKTDRHGLTRELFSKGMGLAMLDQARAEKRDFVGIIFASIGTTPKVFRFPAGKGSIDEVLAFTSTFLGGGTDFERPLDLAMDILEEQFSSERKAKGDLVLLTDDECKVRPAWATTFLSRKQRLGARMFGLALGLPQPGSTLTALSDNVRAVQEFVDPSQVADIVRTI